MSDIDRILSFWLAPSPQTAEEAEAKKQLWFSASEDLDREIKSKFGQLVEAARAGSLDAWAQTPRGTLALIILIDQFSRNLYRGRAEAFACDDKALKLACDGFDAGRFDELDSIERLFAALPLRHAEDVEMQKRAVALAVQDALNGAAHLKEFLIYSVDWARKHLDVIVRFGRFPHRNATLGRKSTPAEEEYLAYLKVAGQWL
jgi:uncharacterized protein (DUF924 family)